MGAVSTPYYTYLVQLGGFVCRSFSNAVKADTVELAYTLGPTSTVSIGHFRDLAMPKAI